MINDYYNISKGKIIRSRIVRIICGLLKFAICGATAYLVYSIYRLNKAGYKLSIYHIGMRIVKGADIMELGDGYHIVSVMVMLVPIIFFAVFCMLMLKEHSRKAKWYIKLCGKVRRISSSGYADRRRLGRYELDKKHMSAPDIYDAE